MNFIITLLILIVVLGIIVFIHELGHFLAAKKVGVYVHEFAIGMGPKVFSFKRKNDETVYSLRLLPLGGFTALASDCTVSIASENITNFPEVFFCGLNNSGLILSLNASNFGSCEFFAHRS